VKSGEALTPENDSRVDLTGIFAGLRHAPVTRTNQCSRRRLLRKQTRQVSEGELQLARGKRQAPAGAQHQQVIARHGPDIGRAMQDGPFSCRRAARRGANEASAATKAGAAGEALTELFVVCAC